MRILKEFGLSGAAAAKAIEARCQPLYNGINGKRGDPEMAVCFEKAFGGGGLWLRIEAAPDLAIVRQSQDQSTPPHAAG
jgi:plasmid maintenance system antidote protein VapI